MGLQRQADRNNKGDLERRGKTWEQCGLVGMGGGRTPGDFPLWRSRNHSQV